MRLNKNVIFVQQDRVAKNNLHTFEKNVIFFENRTCENQSISCEYFDDSSTVKNKTDQDDILKVHVSALGYISLGKEMSVEEKVDFAHSVVGPAMYKFSEGSYYSESEYSLHKEEWGKRFWGRDIYNQLLKVGHLLDHSTHNWSSV